MSDHAPEAAVAPSEGGVEADDLNTTTIVMVGLISTALVLASALGVQALYETFVKLDTAAKSAAHSATAADSVINDQNTSLMGAPHEIAGQPGVYSLPIDLAMKSVVAEFGGEPSSDEAEEAPAGEASSEEGPAEDSEE